jgi:hypothetical protein
MGEGDTDGEPQAGIGAGGEIGFPTSGRFGTRNAAFFENNGLRGSIGVEYEWGFA